MKITEKQFACASVISIVVLFCIWVIPSTIALRHFLLVLGCLSAVGLIYCNRASFRTIDASYLPLFSIFGLFVWVVIHYAFFSLNPALELSEIKGLWMRSLVGVIAAIGLGIAIVKFSNLRLYFYVALFAVPIINVGSYCWASYLNHGWVKPNDFVFFLFAKIETAYFGAIAGSVAVGNLIALMAGKIDKPKVLQILWWSIGLVFILISALISSTKNGIAITLGLCFLLIVSILISSVFSNHGSKKVSALLVITFILISTSIWEGHKSLAYRGWDTVFQDAALGLDIDENKQWQKGEGTVPMPINSLGVPAATNTYTRFAYAAVGIRLIKDYPLGYGSINRSFKGLQEEADIPHEHGGQAHSGWIDFGLAFGIPGLVFIFTALLSIIYLGLKRKSLITLPWMIVCLALIPFGLIAEIAYKQYFEATIFFMTLASCLIILDRKKSQDDRRYD